MQTSKEYSEQLGVDACIKLFEQFKSYEGLYFFLGSYLSSRYSIYFLVGENKTGIHAVFMS